MGWTGYPTKTADEALALHLADVRVIAGPVWRTRTPWGDGRAWVLAQLPSGAGLIVHVLLERGTTRGSERYVYVKDVSEDMGPMRHDAPESWLAIAPDPGGFATAWRAKVRAYWAARPEVAE